MGVVRGCWFGRLGVFFCVCCAYLFFGRALKKVVLKGRLQALPRSGGSCGERVVTNAADFLTVTCVVTMGPSVLDTAKVPRKTLIATAYLSTTFSYVLVKLCTGLPVKLTSNVKLGTFFTFSMMVNGKVSQSVTLATIFIRKVVFVLLSLFGMQRTMISTVPLGLGCTMANKVNLFVTFMNFGKTKLIISSRSAGITVKGFFSPAMLVTIVNLVIVMVLRGGGIGKSVLVNVMVSAIVTQKCTVLEPRSTGLLKVDIPDKVFGFRSLTPVTKGVSFSCLAAPRGVFGFTIVMLAFLFMSFFSAIKALIKMTSETGVLSGSKEMPGTKGTLLISTLKAATKTLVKASTMAACMRDTANIRRKKEAKLATVAVNMLFFVTAFFSPMFVTMPAYTATPTLVCIKCLVLKDVIGVSFSSVARTMPTFLAVTLVPLACDVNSKLAIKILICMILGVLGGVFAGRGSGGGPLSGIVVVLNFMFVLGLVLPLVSWGVLPW